MTWPLPNNNTWSFHTPKEHASNAAENPDLVFQNFLTPTSWITHLAIFVRQKLHSSCRVETL